MLGTTPQRVTRLLWVSTFSLRPGGDEFALNASLRWQPARGTDNRLNILKWIVDGPVAYSDDMLAAVLHATASLRQAQVSDDPETWIPPQDRCRPPGI